MNELVKLAGEIVQKRGLTLILTQDKARESKTNLIASLILKGPLFVLPGDEWLPLNQLMIIPNMFTGTPTGKG